MSWLLLIWEVSLFFSHNLIPFRKSIIKLSAVFLVYIAEWRSGWQIQYSNWVQESVVLQYFRSFSTSDIDRGSHVWRSRGGSYSCTAIMAPRHFAKNKPRACLWSFFCQNSAQLQAYLRRRLIDNAVIGARWSVFRKQHTHTTSRYSPCFLGKALCWKWKVRVGNESSFNRYPE